MSLVGHGQDLGDRIYSDPYLALKEAQSSYNEGDYDKAVKLIKIYQSLLGVKDGEDLLTKSQQCQQYVQKAKLLEEQGDYAGVTQCYKEVLAINPNDPNANHFIERKVLAQTNGQEVTIAGIDFIYVSGERISGIKDFLIGKYEITNVQWRNIMGNIPSATKTLDHPVHNVTYNDAQSFIMALNSSNPGYRFRLPTKEEWLWAAHGGINKETYRYSGSDNYDEVAWLRDNSGVQEEEKYSDDVSHTHRVGTKKPNSLGIYDMSGNVEEIYADLDGKTHKQIGGSYWINYWWAYSTLDTPENYSNSTYEPSPHVGFRLVVEVNTPSEGSDKNIPQPKSPSRTILSKSELIYCDGIYHGPDWEYDYKKTALYENLGPQFNRNFYSMEFDYYMLPDNGDNHVNNIITIDTGRRVFGLSPRGDVLLVTTNNQDNIFDSSIRVSYEKWQHIDLVYYNGTLYINGKCFEIGVLNDSSDNILSSVNFSNGNCFKGYIKNLVVKSN